MNERALLFACVASISAAPGLVHATPPCTCISDRLTGTVSSVDGAGIPTNARLFITSPSPLHPGALTTAPEDGSEGVDVPYTLLPIDTPERANHQAWVVPDAPLAPLTRYTLDADPEVYPRTLTFTTGEGPDTTAPVITEASVGAANWLLCVDSAAATARIGVTQGSTEPLILRAHLSGAGGTREVYVPLTPWGYHNPYEVVLGRQTDWDSPFGSCVATDVAAVEGGLVAAVFTVIDAAGNESEPWEAIPYTYELYDVPEGRSLGMGWPDLSCDRGGDEERPTPTPMNALLAPLLLLRPRPRRR